MGQDFPIKYIFPTQLPIPNYVLQYTSFDISFSILIINEINAYLLNISAYAVTLAGMCIL